MLVSALPVTGLADRGDAALRLDDGEFRHRSRRTPWSRSAPAVPFPPASCGALLPSSFSASSCRPTWTSPSTGRGSRPRVPTPSPSSASPSWRSCSSWPPTGRSDPIAMSGIVVIFWLLQLTFTIGAHLRELVRTGTKSSSQNYIWVIMAPIPVAWLVYYCTDTETRGNVVAQRHLPAIPRLLRAGGSHLGPGLHVATPGGTNEVHRHRAGHHPVHLVRPRRTGHGA